MIKFIKEVDPIVYKDKSRNRKIRRALYECSCGNDFITRIDCVKNEHTKSCGCLHKQGVHITHGLSKISKEYNTWCGIKSRCYNLNDKYYKNYGGRGITVCDRWRNSFELFLKDMDKKLEKEFTIDRIDNNAGYSPDNCRWATQKEQANNRTNNHIVEYKGKRQNIVQWSEETGINQELISSRLIKGWSIEKTLTTKKINTNIQIIQMSNDEKFIKVWESINDTTKENFHPASIKKCCDNKFKQHKGYKWKYLQ